MKRIFGLILLACFHSWAVAQEERVIAGTYTIKVGWGLKPVLADTLNAFELQLFDASGNPVSDHTVELSVKALYLREESFDSVVVAARHLEAPVIRSEAEPHRYRIYFVPTRPGPYGFHVMGSIGDMRFDEFFVCGAGSQDPDKSSFACVERAQRFPGGRLEERRLR